MKEEKKYRKYDEGFKREVLDQVRSGRSVKEVADGLGLSPSLIYRWKLVSETGSSGSPESDELKQLHKRVKELEKDNEILKKALAIFSQHP
jgi:transposase